jgi:hypothetical protein
LNIKANIDKKEMADMKFDLMMALLEPEKELKPLPHFLF